jgi:hypothetical protein
VLLLVEFVSYARHTVTLCRALHASPATLRVHACELIFMHGASCSQRGAYDVPNMPCPAFGRAVAGVLHRKVGSIEAHIAPMLVQAGPCPRAFLCCLSLGPQAARHRGCVCGVRAQLLGYPEWACDRGSLGCIHPAGQAQPQPVSF